MSDQSTSPAEVPMGFLPPREPPPQSRQTTPAPSQGPSPSPPRRPPGLPRDSAPTSPPRDSPPGPGERPSRLEALRRRRPPGAAHRDEESRDAPRAPTPTSSPEALAQLGAIVVSALSTIVNYVMTKRSGARRDWRMTEPEATEVSRALTRMLARRMQVRGDLSDAIDVGTAGSGVLTYVTRVATGGPMPAGNVTTPASSPRARQAATLDQEALQRRFAEQQAKEAAADAARAATEAPREHGGEDTSSEEFLAGFEDV